MCLFVSLCFVFVSCAIVYNLSRVSFIVSFFVILLRDVLNSWLRAFRQVRFSPPSRGGEGGQLIRQRNGARILNGQREGARN